MELLERSLQLAAGIPNTAAYQDERDFCWVAVARAALAAQNIVLFRHAGDLVANEYARAALRVEASSSSPELRRELLEDVVARLEYWEAHLWRRGFSNLASVLASDFGLIAASSLAPRISDPFTRTCWLTDLADCTPDRVLQQSLLSEAWHAAGEVDSDHDYALKHVASGFIQHGFSDSAERAIAGIRDPAIRLDYLDWLAQARAAEGQVSEASSASQERDKVAAENPDVSPQSEMLRDAERLVLQDPPGGRLSNRTVFHLIEDLVDRGEQDQAVEQIKERFPTRFCSPALRLAHDKLAKLLNFQLESVLSYHRNDLKVEFLTDLSVACSREGIQLPDSVISTVLAGSSLLTVEPPSVPSVYARDPSGLAFNDFVDFLFNRPVHRTEEEERFMRRKGDWDSDVADAPALVALSTELFRRFGEVAPQYSCEQVDQGLWYLNSLPLWLPDILKDDRVMVDAAAECIRAAFHVFSDYVASHELPDEVSCFFMFWDQLASFTILPLKPAILDTLKMVLDIDNDACQTAALHGLNHLHPFAGVSEVVDAFLERRGTQLPNDLIDYAKACRGGRAG